MKQEQNLQKVSFQLSDQWYENTFDLKKVYTSVHKAKAYGCSANQLITEMFANLLDLAFQKKIELTFPFIITDYGCGRSKAANVLAEVVSDNADRISTALQNGKSISEILQEISPEIKKENGVWQIEELPEFLSKLLELEELSKKDCSSDQEVQQKAKNLIKEGL